MKNFYALRCSTILLCIIFCSSVQAQWRWLHPNPQGNSLISSYFTDASNGWLGGDGGVLVKTNNGGGSWQNFYTGYFQPVTGIYLSTPQSGIIAQGDRLLKTVNGGNTFIQLYRFADLNIEHLFFLNVDTGWVTGTFAGLNRVAFTVDGGNTWTLQPNPLPDHLNDLTALPGGLTFAPTANGKVYRSLDYGATWNPVTIPAATVLNAISFSDSLNGYTCGENGELFKTIDGGFTWTSVINPASSSSIIFQDLQTINPDTVLVSGSQGFLIKTADGGTTWTVNGQPSWFTGYTYALAGADVFLGGSDGEILKSTDKGDTWNSVIQRVADVNLFGIAAPSAATVYTCGESGTVLKTNNGGASWVNLNVPSSDNFYTASFSSPLTGFVAGDFGKIYRTTNGTNFNLTASGTTNRLAASSSKNSTAYICGDAETLVKSVNDGATWINIPTPLAGLGFNYTGIFFLSPDTGWIVTDQTEVLLTTDGGLNWGIVSVNFNSPLNSIWFNDANNGWICTGSGDILYTTDGGINWSLSYSALTPLHKIIFTDMQNGYAFGDGIILRTANAGANWNIEFDPSSQPIYDAQFVTNTNTDAFAAGAGTASILGRSGDLQASITTASLCTDNTYDVILNTSGIFNPGNEFHIELSDEFGDFSYPLTIGSAFAAGNSIITVTIPNGLADATGYRIRAVSNNPPMFSPVNNNILSIRTSPDAYAIASGPTAFCQGDSLVIYALTSPIWFYQWYKDGALIPGAIADSLTVSATGNYTVEVTDSICTLVSPVVDVLVSVCGGIQTVESSPLRVYPNPADQAVRVSWPSSLVIHRVQLADVNGKIISEQEVNGNVIAIDLTDVAPGIYMLMADGNKRYNARVIRK